VLLSGVILCREPRKFGYRESALWLPSAWQLPWHPVSLCDKPAALGAKEKKNKKEEMDPFFLMLCRRVKHILYFGPINIFDLQVLLCRASTFIYVLGTEIDKPSIKPGVIN
jgi:hypothetical protein